MIDYKEEAAGQSLCGLTDNYRKDSTFPNCGVHLGAGSETYSVFPRSKAIGYCGLCGAEEISGNTVQRLPLSKQRNKHLQTTLIEAAKMAPRNSAELAMLYDKEKQKGSANRATVAVARKLVAYLMAEDRVQRNSQTAETSTIIAA